MGEFVIYSDTKTASFGDSNLRICLLTTWNAAGTSKKPTYTGRWRQVVKGGGRSGWPIAEMPVAGLDGAGFPS